MSIQVSYPELAIYVIVGLEAVVGYQFQNRANFIVGRTSYVVGDDNMELDAQRYEYRGKPKLKYISYTYCL